MKKLLLTFVLFVLTMMSVSAAPYDYAVRVLVNKVEIKSDAKPFIDPKSNRTYVSVRFVTEALGEAVEWNKQTQTVTLVKRDGKRISLKKGDEFAYVNGVKQKSDAPAREVNYRIMVPLRFVSKQLGATVDVTKDQGITTVSIAYPDAPVSKKVEQQAPTKESTPQIQKTYHSFEIDKGYTKLAPHLFKDNLRVENGELIFKVPNLQNQRICVTYLPAWGDGTKLVQGKEYRYKLGDTGCIQFTMTHPDCFVEGYYAYLSPEHRHLKGEFSHVKDDVIIVSDLLTKSTADVLEDVKKLF